MSSLKRKIKKLPDSPGVYFFKRGKRILYIGKATSLRDRVKSYFTKDLAETRGPLLVEMVFQATGIDFVKTDSVLEALLLEAELIKKHQPRYNTKEKDDKSANCVVITDEDFPRVLIVRKKELNQSGLSADNLRQGTSYGPFPHGTELKEALRIIRKIFPFRDAKCVPNQGKPCFNRQIGLCPGICVGEISKTEYGKTIRRVKLFFEGRKKIIIGGVEREMKSFAKREEFEKAGALKRVLFALRHIQDISLIKTANRQLPTDDFLIEAYDVAHTSGACAVGAMAAVFNGLPQKTDYRKFKIKGNHGINDPAGLREILSRRLTHAEWTLPDLIVVDGGVAQKTAAEKILTEHGLNIAVAAVVKDERHKPKAILGNESIARWHRESILLANSEAHRFAVAFHRKKRGQLLSA